MQFQVKTILLNKDQQLDEITHLVYSGGPNKTVYFPNYFHYGNIKFNLKKWDANREVVYYEKDDSSNSGPN